MGAGEFSCCMTFFVQIFHAQFLFSVKSLAQLFCFGQTFGRPMHFFLGYPCTCCAFFVCNFPKLEFFFVLCAQPHNFINGPSLSMCIKNVYLINCLIHLLFQGLDNP